MQGDGVGGARVLVDGHHAATTDEQGTYTLSNITSGSYHLLVCVCVCVCVYVCVCVCSCTCTCVHVHVPACVHTCGNVCVHISYRRWTPLHETIIMS